MNPETVGAVRVAYPSRHQAVPGGSRAALGRRGDPERSRASFTRPGQVVVAVILIAGVTLYSAANVMVSPAVSSPAQEIAPFSFRG